MSQTLHVMVDPEWSNVDRVRGMTIQFLQSLALHREIVDAAAMVTSKPTENAAKYGAFARAEDLIDVTVTVNHVTLTVEVKNPVAAERAKNLSQLDAMIQRIRGYQDPFEAYLSRMKEVSAQSVEDSESGLGLVRVAYEGQAVLDFFINEHDVLAVSATYRM